MRILLLIMLSVSLGAWASTKTMDEQVEEMRRNALSDIDVYACIMQGKVVAAVGMFATPACVDIYGDGGNECNDSSDCQGKCRSREAVEEGTEMSGFCQAGYADEFGCFNLIVAGVAEHAICYD